MCRAEWRPDDIKAENKKHSDNEPESEQDSVDSAIDEVNHTMLAAAEVGYFVRLMLF